MMSPLELEILLHYYGHADDFPRLAAPAAVKALEGMLTDDLLAPNPLGCRRYQITQAGQCFVQKVLAMEPAEMGGA